MKKKKLKKWLKYYKQKYEQDHFRHVMHINELDSITNYVGELSQRLFLSYNSNAWPDNETLEELKQIRDWYFKGKGKPPW
jgi:hypothetical protein